MKDNLILFAISAAWAMLVAMVTFMLTMNDRVIVLETNYSRDIPSLEKKDDHLERQFEHCVKNDLYQLDKMYIKEKLQMCKPR